jgi:predicted transcriptional regulator
MIRLHIALDQQRHGELQALAKRVGLSSSDLLRAALDDFLVRTAKEQAVVVPLRPMEAPR